MAHSLVVQFATKIAWNHIQTIKADIVKVKFGAKVISMSKYNKIHVTMALVGKILP